MARSVIAPLRTTTPTRLGLTCAGLAMIACALGGCSEPQRPPVVKGSSFIEYTPEARKIMDRAQAALDAIDVKVRESRVMPPAQRRAAQEAMGPSLVDAAELCRGTKLENRGWYLLAQWRFAFVDDGTGVEPALDALDRCPSGSLKVMGRSIRLQHLVRQGRLPAARALANELVEVGRAGDSDHGPSSDPFGPYADLVDRSEHCRARMPAPVISGMAVDPATGRESPFTDPGGWRLVLSVSILNPDTRFEIQRLLTAAAGIKDLRLVVLVRDGSPQDIQRAAADLPTTAQGAVLYARTHDESTAWSNDWGTTIDPQTILVDDQGRLRATAIRPGDLAHLVQP